jgi:hypothetical protein
VEFLVVVERKRRRLSLAWSLPVVVAIMFFLVAKLAALQRADVIKELDKRVSHGSTDEATDAVRNLATIPRPPLALLVKAAASPNLDVAREAQQAIDEYLKFCQREVKAGRNTKLVARQLAVLAEALAIERHLFSVVDYPWVESTARKVLRQANRIPTKSTPLVAARCDEILAAVSAAKPQAAGTALNSASLLGSVAVPAGTDARQVLSGATGFADTGQDERLAALAARSWSDSPTAIIGAAAPSFPITLQTPVLGASPLSVDFGDDAAAGLLPDGPSGSPWRAQWTHPILRSLPSGPLNAAPGSRDAFDAGAHDSSAVRGGESWHIGLADERFEGVDSRKLLARWLVAEGSDVYPLEQELMERGFGRLSPRLARQLVSERVEDRLRLVDDVLTDPGIDARPWLLLLADDADGDVRLVAVTIMATSRDAELIEKAWQVAIRDRDPRIAGLAERLRERRGGARRR